MEFKKDLTNHHIPSPKKNNMSKDEPKVAVVMGTGAEGIRALFSDSKTVKINDLITVPPVISGKHGKAWLCDVAAGYRELNIKSEDDACLAHWIIEAPWAHPIWHSYSLVLVHLRPMPDNRPTLFYIDGATHEFWLRAMDPYKDRNELLASGIIRGHCLSPSNFAAQFIEITDDLAMDRIRVIVKMICDGALSPDTDWRSDWIELFGNNMIREEYR